MSGLTVTVRGSEPSLAARLLQAPTNAWLAAPDSALPGAPAPEVYLRPTVPLVLLGKLGGGGRPGRMRIPPDYLVPKSLDIFVLLSSAVPPPPLLSPV